jgi:hypothetical protein
MDNTSLAPLLVSARTTFWLKSQGILAQPVGPDEYFGGPRYFVGFSSPPSRLTDGDVLIVYRVGVSMLQYIGLCEGAVRKATPDEIRQDAWRAQWPWGIDVRNLTPQFGRTWPRHELKPFRLAREYKAAHPHDPQRLGALQFGKGIVPISSGFGRHLVGLIAAL